MTVDRATQSLLDLVEADRAQKCAAILDEARGRAAALRAQAHADAQSRMRQAFAEERERRAARIAAAEATLATRQRLALQRRASALLATGWLLLPEALAERWRDAAARQAWVRRIVGDARAQLLTRAWRVIHAPDWPAVERDALAAELAAAGIAPAFVAEPRIEAGLKVAADGNVIDGTLQGILADRAEIGALLLQEMETGEVAS
jgi:hypothetical protein